MTALTPTDTLLLDRLAAIVEDRVPSTHRECLSAWTVSAVKRWLMTFDTRSFAPLDGHFLNDREFVHSFLNMVEKNFGHLTLNGAGAKKIVAEALVIVIDDIMREKWVEFRRSASLPTYISLLFELLFLMDPPTGFAAGTRALQWEHVLGRLSFEAGSDTPFPVRLYRVSPAAYPEVGSQPAAFREALMRLCVRNPEAPGVLSMIRALFIPFMRDLAVDTGESQIHPQALFLREAFMTFGSANELAENLNQNWIDEARDQAGDMEGYELSDESIAILNDWARQLSEALTTRTQADHSVQVLAETLDVLGLAIAEVPAAPEMITWLRGTRSMLQEYASEYRRNAA